MKITDINPGDYFLLNGKTFMKGKPNENGAVRIINPKNGDITCVSKNHNVTPVFQKAKDEDYIDRKKLLHLLFSKIDELSYEEIDGASAILYYVTTFPTADVYKHDDIEEKVDRANNILIRELNKENIKPEAYNNIFYALKAIVV